MPNSQDVRQTDGGRTVPNGDSLMQLSHDAVLVYVLHSGCVGRLTVGRVEQSAGYGLNVYSPYASAINDYISGPRLRSWCVIGRDGKPLPGWYSIRLEDHRLLGVTTT